MAERLDTETPVAELAPALSWAARNADRVLEALAASDCPVLVTGEEGTGKRTLSRRLHVLTFGDGDRLLAVQAAAIGAAMGAHMFAPTAGNGKSNGWSEAVREYRTLIIEEVSEVDLAWQPRLLQALVSDAQGADRVRVIATSSRNLEHEVRLGRFREDLFFTLSAAGMRLAPLRARREDIPVLIEFFLAKYAALFRRPAPQLSAELRAALLEHSWPGNISELENTMRAVAAIGDESVAAAALRRNRRPRTATPEAVSLKQAARAASRHAERELILKVLSRTRWNRKRAAAELQISYKALLYKLKQTGLEEHPGA